MITIVKRNTEAAIKLAQAALLALVAAGFPKAPGWCLKWVRLVFNAAFGPDFWPVPIGLDAAGACEWLEKHGYMLAPGDLGMIGDVYFWVGPGHGKHGHVEIRVPGNRTAGNYSPNAFGDDMDARGDRPMTKRNRPTHVARILPRQ